MKLRNKKTGEITNPKDLLTDEFIKDLFSKDYNYFKSKLDKFYEEWEGYKEPEMFYWIDYDGKICKAEIGTMDRTKIKQIGNYFETKEEAEKAIRKLKAWKLLKDECDIKFDGIIRDDKAMLKGVKLTYDRHTVTFDRMRECIDALHFLFGGEE